MAVNYNDKRFAEVEADKQVALSDLEKTYAGMIDNSDKYYQSQIDASKQWAETQQKNQQAQTDFAIDKIEQEKAQAKKDYTKEQSGAYVDWQKQSNQYGATAEQQAAQGLARSGYSESAQVGMYNTYQNRITAARESYNLAVQNYNNSITEARLKNNSVLAEIAAKALQQQLELSLQGFQYKNQLVLEKANKKTELEQIYHSRYQDVLQQINTENALEYQKEQAAKQNAIQEAQLALEREKWDYQKAQQEAAKIKKANASTNGTSYSRNSYVKKQTNDEKKIQKAEAKNQPKVSAAQYLNQLIASGASKDKVSNEIAIALRKGEITKAEAAKLRQTFTPRGLAY